MPSLEHDEQCRVAELQLALSRLQQRMEAEQAEAGGYGYGAGAGGGGYEDGGVVSTAAELEAVVEELDGLVGSECPRCGSVMIRSVRRPLIEDANEEKEWAV